MAVPEPLIIDTIPPLAPVPPLKYINPPAPSTKLLSPALNKRDDPATDDPEPERISISPAESTALEPVVLVYLWVPVQVLEVLFV